MKKLIFLSILLIVGCASNIPILDVDEALKIKPNMTKNDILKNIGKPFEIRAGIALDNNDLIELWILFSLSNLSLQMKYDKPNLMNHE
jgi:hypothetical protein